jgi:hypothetical protein
MILYTMRVEGSSAQKEKWFQVTLKTDRFPTGMHGRNLAFGNGVA